MESEILSRFGTLSHPDRMGLFRLLMRRYPDAVPAGEIAAILSLKPSTASVHLGTLTDSGLISRTRQGTSLRYQAAIPAMREMVDFLVLDCCRGRSELCTSLSLPDPQEATMADRPLNALFICSGNSARSIFAEALLRDLGQGAFNVYSAGMTPAGTPNPFALEMLQDKGHDTSALRSKNIAEFQGPDAPVMDFVFTVCDQAANEECATWDGQPISAHWGLPDPVKATGTDAQKRLAFQQTYGMLRNRIRAFAALPFDSLDRISLQSAVDDLAQPQTEESPA